MSSVRLENIYKNFGNIKAISNLDLEIKDGEFFVLLGPTGAGKTTTLRIISGLEMPDYFKNHPIYYAGPAKTPKGHVTGSFGPTTAGRMDSYVDLFQKHGGSKIMLAKGNRSKQVTEACMKNGGFYLGSIGGPGAELAQNNITKVECLEYPELGMEAIWKIEVKEFPAFIVIDDKGNDFFDSFDIS